MSLNLWRLLACVSPRGTHDAQVRFCQKPLHQSMAGFGELGRVDSRDSHMSASCGPLIAIAGSGDTPSAVVYEAAAVSVHWVRCVQSWDTELHTPDIVDCRIIQTPCGWLTSWLWLAVGIQTNCVLKKAQALSHSNQCFLGFYWIYGGGALKKKKKIRPFS